MSSNFLNQNSCSTNDITGYFIENTRPQNNTSGFIDYQKNVASIVPELITRGKKYTNPIQCITLPSLRIGFFLQAISLMIILFMHHGNKGLNTWTFDLFNISENIRFSQSFLYSLSILLITYNVGTIMLIIFQAFIADNGKYSRGFRAGSKMLQTALIMDLLVNGLRFLSFIYTFKYIQDRWWMHLSETKADFALTHFSHLVHGISLILYGLGIFYIEAYHDEGTYEEFAWVILLLLSVAGLSEIVLSLTGYGAFFAYIQLIGVVITTFWAFSFEPLIHYHMNTLHDRTLNDSVLSNNYGLLNHIA